MHTLLVVEDEDSIRNLLVDFLKSCGHAVVAVAHGREAERWLQHPEVQPSAVITDITMPEMDGLELLSILRERWPSIPIIAMTGYTAHGYLPLARRLGARFVLTKPFQLQELGDALQDILGGPA